MSNAKFTIGESVRFQAPAMLRSHYQDGFTITRVLPFESGEHQYRIKNAAEAHERVALESQLAPSMAGR